MALLCRCNERASSSRARHRRATLAIDRFAALSGVIALPGRHRSARATFLRIDSPVSCARMASGAVSHKLWIWLAAAVRAFMAPLRATRSWRSASTGPVPALGVAVALEPLVAATAPELLTCEGVGTDVAEPRCSSPPATTRNDSAPSEPSPSSAASRQWTRHQASNNVIDARDAFSNMTQPRRRSASELRPEGPQDLNRLSLATSERRASESTRPNSHLAQVLDAANHDPRPVLSGPRRGPLNSGLDPAESL